MTITMLLDKILSDDNTKLRDTSHDGKTLKEFLDSIEFKLQDPPNITLNELYEINNALSCSGIEKLTIEDLFISQKPNNIDSSIKLDAGKTQYHLLVPSFSRRIAEVLTYSAAHKYKPNSWQGLPDGKNRYYDALMRHISEWWEKGSQEDPEDKIHPLIHAACNIMFLVYLDEHAEAE